MRANRGLDLRGELVGAQLAVDPLDHARVGVAHHRRDEVRREAFGAQPVGEGPSQVVGRARLDVLAGAGEVQGTARVAPRREEHPVAAVGVFEREA
ncbi:MAG: hypothetical protein U0326_35040 [Polyangiales bacterium]